MTSRRIAMLSVSVYGAAAIAILVLVPAPQLHRIGPGAGAIVGTAAGLGAFLLLGRRLPRVRGRPHRSRRRLGALAAVIIVAAAFEEIVWRHGVLGGLAQLLGVPGAWALSTMGFALRHARLRAPQSLVAYLVLGGVFGGAYLLTGRLLDAIVAHAAYNILAAAARLQLQRPEASRA